MKPDRDGLLGRWQQRCQAHGLMLTAARNAILRALIAQTQARDAVPLLQAAQIHHAATSIGTVYRFLRELEQRGLVDTYAQAHGRMRWQLRDESLTAAAHPAGDIRQMLTQVQDSLRTLEQQEPTDRARAVAVLHALASQLGYRLLPRRESAA
ncbi:transcriptional repressor [Dyella acidiphila]|uniref:Transcriptional repressor n=1 Tax=Dyella acidiphila TaxID=2775866 RepID=A0ABR9GDM4_9GAMM|nr:transcriptional repressor [Dyella acidiphila]MBE1162153.1 transcriptional repressor [Dyella acidiphila]